MGNLFITDTLLHGVGELENAAKVLAEQLAVDSSLAVWEEICSGRWRLTPKTDTIFPVWKYLSIEGVQSEDLYLKRFADLRKSGKCIYVSRHAKRVLGGLQYSKEQTLYEVILISPEKFGFTDYCDYTQFVGTVLSTGNYDKCPPELALEIRLQYLDQTRLSSGCVIVAMDPIIQQDTDEQSIFVLEHNGEQMNLDTVELPFTQVDPVYQVAFVKKK